jgi:hypothetical protein
VFQVENIWVEGSLREGRRFSDGLGTEAAAGLNFQEAEDYGRQGWYVIMRHSLERHVHWWLLPWLWLKGFYSGSNS